jgi:hypothetical protein
MIFGTLPSKVTSEKAQEILDLNKREGEEYSFICAAKVMFEHQLFAVSNIRIVSFTVMHKKVFYEWDPKIVTELIIDSNRLQVRGAPVAYLAKIDPTDVERLREACANLGLTSLDKNEKKRKKQVGR